MELSIADIRDLHTGIQQLYTLHDLDTFGVKTLTIVDRLVPGDIPEFHLTNLRERQISSTFLPNFSGLTPAIEQVIQQHFEEHPLVQQMPQTLNGVHKISDFISLQELYGLEGLYQQCLRLFDTEDQITFFLPNIQAVHPIDLLHIDATLLGFSIQRKWGQFTERDRLILNLLRPHLAQSYNNAQHCHQLQQERDLVQQSLNHIGAIGLDGDLRVKSIAPQTISWLETYFPKSTCAGELPDHLRSWVKYQIDRLTHHYIDPPQTCLPLRLQQAGRELTIRLMAEPCLGQYLLLLTEQTLSSLNLLRLLGLSQRETEVLKLVIQGENNKAIASQLNIHASTVRKHLENIYAKWGVRSRTEAIAKALREIGFL